MYLVRMFVISYLLTVVVEEIAALIWGYRKAKDLLTVLWINTVTNPVAVGLRFLSAQFVPSQIWRTMIILVVELGVVLAEWRLFRRFLSKGKYPFFFSLTLNAASYGSGYLIPLLLPLIMKLLK